MEAVVPTWWQLPLCVTGNGRNIMGSPIVFFILATVAILAAAGMLTSRNAIHSALYLVLNFCTVAVFYLILKAPFISMVQITVYAGAIVVLFLFVIMLLGAEKLPRASSNGGLQYLVGILSVLALGVALVLQLTQGSTAGVPEAAFDSSPEAIGIALFENYVFPFEITSLILLVAMMSLIVFKAKKRKKPNG